MVPEAVLDRLVLAPISLCVRYGMSGTDAPYGGTSVPWTIMDFPRFSHRELLVDTGRNARLLLLEPVAL